MSWCTSCNKSKRMKLSKLHIYPMNLNNGYRSNLYILKDWSMLNIALLELKNNFDTNLLSLLNSQVHTKYMLMSLNKLRS